MRKDVIRRHRIEYLRNEVQHNRLVWYEDLVEICNKWGIEPYEEVLSIIDYNTCDRCGIMDDSDNLIWTEYLEEGDACDEAFYRGMEHEGREYTSVCTSCYREVRKDIKGIKQGRIHGTRKQN